MYYVEFTGNKYLRIAWKELPQFEVLVVEVVCIMNATTNIMFIWAS